MASLGGKVVAITGASSGIGLACAHELARRGAAVVLGARRIDRLETAAAEIQRAGGRASALAVDVTRQADVDALVARATTQFSRLDVMICNAGFGYYGTIEQTPPDMMRQMIDVNYMGTFLAARAALPLFRAQQSGHLIFVSSIGARRGIAFRGGYTATKAAQSGLAEALRTEFAGTSIHVSCIYPISTETEFHDAMARHYGHRVTGLGPRQPVDVVARAIAECIEHPRPEVYPHAKSRALGILSLIAPAYTDRFVQKFARHRDAAAHSQ
jgi:NADP-dependent 3-hydroxy acid dehydrogenase YdfG